MGGTSGKKTKEYAMCYSCLSWKITEDNKNDLPLIGILVVKALYVQKGTVLGFWVGAISLNWYLRIIILKNRIRKAWNSQEAETKRQLERCYFSNEAWEDSSILIDRTSRQNPRLF